MMSSRRARMNSPRRCVPSSEFFAGLRLSTTPRESAGRVPLLVRLRLAALEQRLRLVLDPAVALVPFAPGDLGKDLVAVGGAAEGDQRLRVTHPRRRVGLVEDRRLVPVL